MTAYLFPGQGAQFPGMGKDRYDASETARARFETANDLLGFRLTDVMFGGTDEELKQTRVTQPAIFLHSVVLALETPTFRLGGTPPDMVAGHSLGEFSALVAAGALSFEDGLKLVFQRAMAMQRACERTPSTMAAVLGLADGQIEEICAAVQAENHEIVVAANYNCPGQVVISGSLEGVRLAGERLKVAGAKTRAAAGGGRGVSLAADGTRPRRTGCGHRGHAVSSRRFVRFTRTSMRPPPAR